MVCPSRLLSRLSPLSFTNGNDFLTNSDSLTAALSRVKSNLSYFRTNYAILLSLTLAFSLLSHPFSLLLILSLLSAWCSLYLFRPSDPPLVLFGRQFSERETLGGLVLLSVIVFFMTSVGSLLILAVMIGSGVG
ncbi:PRA1 family protein B2-like [Asparagus officinalis]|uniref:PRA1 family protein B2-like n=1 Tax=Asparagus officinalis TaxID=4686 RepID=UPI00098E61FD|nr:PRA1 family protein B2-like [Asparagus officinalis]